MPDPIPAAEIRAAAERIRSWVVGEPSNPLGPTALATFGPDLARWLEAVAIRLESTVLPFWQDTAEPQALATARAINAWGQPC